MSPRSRTVRTSSLWLLSAGGEIQDGVELSTPIEHLLAVLEPKGEQLWLLDRQGYEANWFCYVDSRPAEHAVELNRPLLSWLLALPGDLWIDVG